MHTVETAGQVVDQVEMVPAWDLREFGRRQALDLTGEDGSRNFCRDFTRVPQLPYFLDGLGGELHVVGSF